MLKILRVVLVIGAFVAIIPLLAWLANPSSVIAEPTSDPTGLLRLVYEILPPTSPIGTPAVWFYAILTFGGMEATTLALVLVVRAWDRPGVPLLSVFLVANTVFFGTMLLAVPHGVPAAVTGWLQQPLAWVWQLMVSSLFGFGLAALITFARTFPRELVQADFDRLFKPTKFAISLSLDSRHGWVVLPLATIVQATLVFIWPEGRAGWAMVFYPFMGLGVLFSAHQLFRVGASSANPKDARRIAWISSGISGALWLWFAFGILAFSLIWVAGDAGVYAYMAGLFVYGPLGMAIVVVTALGLAVLVGGAVDPGLVVKRTTVYGTLLLLFGFAFAVAEELLSGLLVDRIGISDRAVSVLLGAAVALAITPLKALVDRGVEAWLPSGRESKKPSSDPI